MCRGPMLAQPMSIDDARIATLTQRQRCSRRPVSDAASNDRDAPVAGEPSRLRSVFIGVHPWFLPQPEQKRGSLHRPEGAERPDHVGRERFDPTRPADLQLLQKPLQQLYCSLTLANRG